MLFVVKYAEESETAWRTLNARTREEARAQAVAMAEERWVEYGEVDAETGLVSLLGCVREDPDEPRRQWARTPTVPSRSPRRDGTPVVNLSLSLRGDRARRARERGSYE
jgi:hypothetical protein